MSGYLLDSSALWRLLRDRQLHEAWRPIVMDGDIRSCYPQRAEFLRSARGLKEYEAYSAMFAELYDDISVPKNAHHWIGGLQLRAAERGEHQALSAVDLQICATAAHHGLVVLHDDRDFVTAARLAVELRQLNVHQGPL
ncbi:MULTISPECIES: PIN domain-containing protein [Streptomyces]|uniref:Ribonuclease VapC n=1 Tax=Streptomyces caniscabiei TaxID=2746961 RepID=A0ABU4MVF1_9ACTN|nr:MULTISPECIES: PIN domain-containing protein [Streptomyces]MBE4738191.1 PIN domain-containing protein [Streptomyces caniscabiei]MBE4756953.1 PIN domain-containing protein [Streptomyces caniscabiei]MBE4773893.1 PIN domain-containing protein [Streptomyces caniscabiei]MBE4785537.1 PIN domain-containing protein [Streptomyces caniscabiei]MBE4796879.1 PIN domain-containing protein [Streptomyces caniscabiei]